MKRFTVCTVCKILDNDLALKHCTYCELCKAWLCDDDVKNYARRARAIAKILRRK